MALLVALSASAGRAQTIQIPLANAPANAPSFAQDQSFAPVRLRGYGLVSGALRTSAGGGSILRVETESPQKAALLQAKFLSDLALSPGVQSAQLTVGTTQVAVSEARSQGVVAALGQGKSVFLVAAPNRAQMLSLLGAVPALSASRASVAVPMWLDRFDKFSFRHYYRPWEVPPGATTASYDFLHEFDYAKEEQRAGMVFWNDAAANDPAEGIMNTGWWDWAAQQARKRELPVGLNNSLPDTTWLLNRYREQTQQKMPDFTGNFYWLMSPYLGGQGDISWNATTAKDAQLGLLQDTVRRFASYANTTTILEPHGELRHGNQDIFLEYGPVADANYRRFLKEKYAAPPVVSARWKRDVKSWNDVRVPELVSFAGWGEGALDLGGTWRVGYEELTEAAKSPTYYDQLGTPKSKPAPDSWYQPGFDDASWPQLKVPGNDQQMFLSKRPAVFRRDFEVSAPWKAKNPRVWLYVWDLNMATGDSVRLVVNGQEVGSSKIEFFTPHWSAFDVSSALQAGKNTVALRLPQGYLSYKTYLSATPPRQYPNLGEGLNAQWVDFSDFTQWSRVEAAKRGVEMIRQVAPNHQIVLMAPLSYADGVKDLATRYGGEFHDTGFMGAFFADYLSSVSRGADLPASVEPGNPAGSLDEWKKQIGLYQLEGVQGLDYFIHIGSILWNPEIKADYEAHRSQLSLLGQSHYEKAETAVLYSDRVAQLTGYPWGAAPNTGIGGGYWNWNVGSVLRGSFPYDGLTQSSFARGEAKPYRVIVDSNTSIMDQSMVSDIEKWVRAGGTFVTVAQTGRHTPEQPNSWPIARLTGYAVTHIDQLKENGNVEESGTLQIAPDQKIFDAKWNGARANGLHLRKVAPEAQNLLMWQDGGVAAGVRPLGKGFVVQLGAKFSGSKIFDRVEPDANTNETRQLRALLSALLDWRGVRREAAHLAGENENVWLRPAVTNNGLYDTWTLFNWSKDRPQTASVVLERGKNPSFAIDARDGKPFPVTPSPIGSSDGSPDGAKLENIVLQPLETRVFLSPRGELAQAPSAWFALQRHWWRGVAAPPKSTVLPSPAPRFARNLTGDWKFQTLDTADAAPLSTTNLDDKAWKTRSLGVWNTAESGNRGVFRKTFVVPTEWKAGRTALWMTSWYNTSFVERGRVWLDGKEVKALNADAYIALGLEALTPGTTHTLAVEVQSEGVLAGLRGQCWMSFEPTPAQKLDLAGQWQPSVDALKYEAAITLPGRFTAQMLRREVVIDATHAGQNVVLTVEGSRELVGVMVNGHSIRRQHHLIGDRWSLNISPFVRFGAPNEIQIERWENSGAGEVREVSLGFFDPKFYP